MTSSCARSGEVPSAARSTRPEAERARRLREEAKNDIVGTFLSVKLLKEETEGPDVRDILKPKYTIKESVGPIA